MPPHFPSSQRSAAFRRRGAGDLVRQVNCWPMASAMPCPASLISSVTLVASVRRSDPWGKVSRSNCAPTFADCIQGAIADTRQWASGRSA
ncbi:hypothetical protein Pden_1059 [Paracoccus denitrificans PD1222]|uniref:Uncharacterized protein n=1 Tax=Paracoccus denitrificans (strain Pd 1222) TaxID=318586 RepID=A1B0X4_PARDP|nr:hypothetical protein Pden_1059 [Paracoccus denitrificans PD1222]